MNLYDLGGETHLKGCPNSDLRRTEVVVLHRCSPLRIRKPGPARLAAHAVRALPRLTRRTSAHRRALDGTNATNATRPRPVSS